MTKDKKAKQAARDQARKLGGRYTAARRQERTEFSGGGAASGGGGGGTGFGDPADFPDPPSINDLARDAVVGMCDWLSGASADPSTDRSGTGIPIAVDLHGDVSDVTISSLEIEPSSVDVHVDEAHEGGTLSCNVTATGILTIDSVMSKADAYRAEADGRLVIQEELNNHYVSVLTRHEVDLTFEGRIDPDLESAELELVGAEQFAP